MRGFCECGCGQKTDIAKKNCSSRGWVKGQPKRFIKTHHVRKRYRLREFTLLPDPMWCSWFAGFFDGEGSFYIQTYKEKNRPNTFTCHVSITLREDDKPILEEIQTRLGGFFKYRCPDYTKKKIRNPQWTWRLNKKGNLARIVNLFDKYPLKSKKSKDYLIWREAFVYQLEGRHYEDGREYAEALKRDLKAVKVR